MFGRKGPPTLYGPQWSFRKTGTMGPLASQAEIGVWVQSINQSIKLYYRAPKS